MTRLDRRNRHSENAILEKRYIRMVMREEGEEIFHEQNKKMGRSGFKSRELFANRKIEATETVLSYAHLARHRFIDMKRRRTKNGIIKKKNYPIHNRVLYGYANNVVRRISFGFTESTWEIMNG